MLTGTPDKGSWGYRMHEARKDLNWDTNLPHLGVMCTITNYAQTAILNVEADIGIKYHAVINTENGFRSGEIIGESQFQSPRVNIGIGDRNVFSFFVRNHTNACVELTLPTTIRMQPVGDNQWNQVALIPPRLMGAYLQPFSFESYQSASPARPEKTKTSRFWPRLRPWT